MKNTHKTASVKVNPAVKRQNTIIISCVILIILGLFSYRQSLNNGFTNWDDDVMLLQNPLVHSLSSGNIAKIFTEIQNNMYHPLVTLSYAIEYSFAGEKPYTYHFTNLALHILSSILVFFIFYRLSGNNIIALITSALFAVHPLHVESVAWITERKDMLFSFFFLSALLFYLYYRERPVTKYYLCVIILFFMSCLSKTTAVVFPLALVLIDYYYDKKFTLKSFRDKIPFFLISIAFAIINIGAQYKETFSGVQLEIPEAGIPERILFTVYNFWFYIYKAIVPVNLSAFYPYPNSPLPAIFYISPLIAGAIIFAVWYSLRYTNKISFGLLFYAAAIFPVLQLIPVGRSISADRFAYIPLIGLFYLAALGINYIYSMNSINKNIRYLISGSAAAIIIFLGYLSNEQCMIWKDSMTLYSDMIKKDPNTSIAYNNRGTIYLQNGSIQQAESDFLNAVRVNNKYSTAYNNLGLVCNNRTEYDKAIGYFRQAVTINPNYAEAHFNLGLAHFNKNEPDSAIVLYRKAIQLDPDFVTAYNNLGKAYGLKNMNSEAVACFKKAIEIEPKYSTAHYNLAVSYLKTGNNQEGISEMQAAARLGNTSAIEFLKTNKLNWQ